VNKDYLIAELCQRCICFHYATAVQPTTVWEGFLEEVRPNWNLVFKGGFRITAVSLLVLSLVSIFLNLHSYLFCTSNWREKMRKQIPLYRTHILSESTDIWANGTIKQKNWGVSKTNQNILEEHFSSPGSWGYQERPWKIN
jgi:hypothetical protein